MLRYHKWGTRARTDVSEVLRECVHLLCQGAVVREDRAQADLDSNVGSLSCRWALGCSALWRWFSHCLSVYPPGERMAYLPLGSLKIPILPFPIILEP